MKHCHHNKHGTKSRKCKAYKISLSSLISISATRSDFQWSSSLTNGIKLVLGCKVCWPGILLLSYLMDSSSKNNMYLVVLEKLLECGTLNTWINKADDKKSISNYQDLHESNTEIQFQDKHCRFSYPYLKSGL